MVLTLNDLGEQNCAVFKDLMPKSTLTHHLKILREAGVTKLRIDGTQHFYSIRMEGARTTIPWFDGDRPQCKA